MKRRIFSVLFAVVLACSLGLVTAVPVAAAATLNVIPYTLGFAGGDAAEWSTANTAPSGSYSAKLTHTASASAHAWVQFTPPTGISLAEFVAAPTTYGFTYWRTVGGGKGPQFELRFTDGANALVEITADMAYYDYLSSDPLLGPGQWIDKLASSTEQCQYYGNDSAGAGLSGTGVFDDWSELITNIAAGATADDAAAVGAWEMTRVRVDLGWSADAQDSAWVDDVIIDGTTYDLEGTADDLTTIQAAITAAEAGDTITVVAGIYVENVNVDKSLTLTGASSATVTVGAADNATSVFTVTADNVTISGFTATGATGPYVGDQHAGIYFPTHVENCNIHDNILTNNIVGILMLDTEDTTTAGNNTFTSNNASTNLASGIEMQHTYGNTFTSNTANSNGKYGFCLDSARNNTFTGNTANSNTRYGFWLKRGEGAVGSNCNTFTNNTANSNTKSGVCMTDLCGDSTYTGNTFDSNVIAGMELGGTAGDVTDNLTVNSNSFSGNAIGVKIDTEAIITSVVLRYNNIVGNTDYGASNDGTGTLNATDNWWGNASGPQPDSAVYTSYGDKVSTLVTYNPWLLEAVTETTPQPPTFDKTLALKKDWTLVSTDKEVTTNTTWVGTNEVSPGKTILAYKYTPDTGYPQVFLATQLTSVDAYYVKTDGGGGVGINYSTAAPGVVTKTLSAGWNVISCAGETDAYVLLSQLHYVQIGEQEGTGLTSLVGQGGYNQFTNSISETLVTDAEWAAIGVTLNAFDGYWVQMNADKSFGVIP